MIYYPFTPHTVPLSIHLQPHRRLQLRRRQDLLRKNGNVTKVPYQEHVPPDVTACIFWLKNRDPAHWRDVQQMEHVLGSTYTASTSE